MLAMNPAFAHRVYLTWMSICEWTAALIYTHMFSKWVLNAIGYDFYS